MAQEEIKNLKVRIAKAESLKDERRSLNEGAYEIAMPQRNLYNTGHDGSASHNVGETRMCGVFTSSGISTVNNFVNNMQNSLTPPFQRWAELQAGDSVPEDQQDDLNIILDELTTTVFTFIDNSNFATAAPEMYYDLCVGTGTLLVNKGEFDKPLNFQAIPTAQVALEEGVFNSIGGVFRKHRVPARLIEHQWPDVSMPDDLVRMVKEKPNDDVVLDEVTYLDMASNKWYYEILWFKNEKQERLLSRVTDYNPWQVVRWSKIAGEVEGRGPLLQALPDLKMLNHGKEMAAISTQMNAFGSYTMEADGILDTRSARIHPGGFLIVKNNPGGPNAPSIAALPRVGDTNAQEFFFEGLQDDIKKIMLDNKLPSEAGAVRSPTEIVERIREFQADFGAAFGRLMHEFITPLFRTILIILDEAGKIDIPTIKIKNPITGVEEVKKITDEVAFTKIKMLAPVAKSQALEDIQNIVQAIQVTQGIDPRLALVGYKVEDMPKFFGEKLGVPTKLVRNKTEQAEAIGTLATLLGQTGGAQ